MHIPPNWGTFGVLIVSFLVFWFIFSRLFFRPFLNLLSEREERFRSLTDRTEQLLKEARAADEAREQRLNAIRREATEHRDSERRRIEAEAAQLLETAKADARASLDAAQTRIEGELKAAEHDLEQMGRTLASELAERVLGRRLNGSGTYN
jgi:F0F1-type ATP synthase membrane subunit b/b'